MKKFLNIISVLIIAFGAHNAAFADSRLKQDAGAVNSACSQDAQTAGCSGEVVGKGLLKCLKNYKRTNKSFKLSPDCKAAIGELREDRKEKGRN